MHQPAIGNRSCALIAAAAVALLAAPVAASDVTLEAYVARVLDAGLAARALAADVDVAQAELEGAGVWPNPRVEVSRQANAAGARAGETQDQALVSIPLVVSGRLGLERESAQYGVEAARARLTHARGQLRHEATAAYLDVVAARRRVAVHRASVQTLRDVVDAVRAREKAGDAAGYERVRIELEVARLESALASAVAAERAALSRARSLWPATAGALEIADEDLASPLSSVAGAGVEQRGDVRALTAELESAKRAGDAAARAWIPEPTLAGGAYVLDVAESERGAGYLASLEVPLPIFDHGQREGSRARARAAQLEAQRALLLHRANAELDAARAAAEAHAERARRHDADVLSRAQELLSTTTQAYRAGGMELLALVDAERASIEAETMSIELRLAARAAENDLLLISGGYDEPAGSDR